MTADDQITHATDDVVAAAQGWLAAHGRVVLATVVDTWGSAPVPVGGRMAVAPDARFAGSASGGCVEADVVAEAADTLEDGRTRTLSFGVADETAWAAGLPCGGSIRILLERLERDNDGADLDTVAACHRGRHPLVVATSLAGAPRTLFRAGDPVSPDHPAAAAVAQAFRDRSSRLVATTAGEFFIHALMPRPRIVVVGATHVAQSLVALARTVDYEAVVVDPRTAFATPARFPGTQVVAEWPEDALARLAPDAATAIVVVAHIAHIDDQALLAGLQSHARYVGALGSKRNHAKRCERLLAAGIGAEDVARIHAPIGLDIGARTPAEIALSIIAEIVHAFRGSRR